MTDQEKLWKQAQVNMYRSDVVLLLKIICWIGGLILVSFLYCLFLLAGIK